MRADSDKRSSPASSSVRTVRARWLTLMAVALVASCATLATQLRPDRRDSIKAPHARHTEAKVECLACHENIFEAVTLRERNLPAEKKCLECHKEEKAKGNCGFCHTNPEHPATFAPVEKGLAFSHQKHLELPEVQEKCERCHTKLPEPGSDPASWAPPMEGCFSCHTHQQQWADADCASCHSDLTRFPLKPVSSFSHRDGYLRAHAQDARAREGMCASCHEQTFCTDCHASTVPTRVELKLAHRVDRSFIHWMNYEARHSIEARADSALCQRCHGVSFCETCHTQRGLTQEGRRPLDPHPPAFRDRGSPEFHGVAARRDIASCAACHDQGAQSNCVECHRVGGVGGNPHPPSWVLRHPREEINRNAMCLACHP